MDTAEENKDLVRLNQGSYSDVIFVLLPYMTIFLQRAWAGDIERFLLGGELSVVAAILGGLSISKLIQGVAFGPALNFRRDRLVLIISLTLFVIVVPSLILITKLIDTNSAPAIVAYIQPAMLVVSVSLYLGVIRFVKGAENDFAESDAKDSKPVATKSPFRPLPEVEESNESSS